MAKISESASKLVIDALQTILAASDKVLTKDEIEFLKRLQSRLEPPLIEKDINGNYKENSKSILKSVLPAHDVDYNNNKEDIIYLKTNIPDPYNHINFEICKQYPGLVLFENEIFELQFDIPTPRPHLIILFKERTFRKSHASVRDLKPNELQSLLNLVEQFMIAINAQTHQHILSFHTGTWASAKHFHAHISIEIDLYLRLLNAKNLGSWHFKITKNWNVNLPSNGLKDLYIKNVKNYKNKNSMDLMRYKTGDLNKIRVLKGSEVTYKPFSFEAFYKKKQLNISFDMNVPKIVFDIRKKFIDTFQSFGELKSDLLRSMVDCADKNGYFGKNLGSHICFQMGSNFEAYLRVAPEKFYEIHPNREVFLANFEKTEHYFET